MTRQCTVCVHPQRDQIDTAIIAAQPQRNIAQQFGLSYTAVNRHKKDHLAPAMVKASQAAEVARADTLLDQVRSLQAKALAILQRAEDGNDLKTALLAIREARATLELLARLQGELTDSTTVNVLVTSGEWLALRAAILRAVEPFPAARAAILEAVTNVG